MEDKEKEFNYTYSALTTEEKQDILKIQRQYQPLEEQDKDDKISRLKDLDKSVKAPAQAVSCAMGIIGFLCFGLGMSMVLEWQIILWGAVVGVVGLVLMGFAYAVYNKILAKRKEKYADQILALSQDLLDNKEKDNVNLDIK